MYRLLDKSAYEPLFKWPGGKRRLVKKLCSLLPKDYSSYHEPFFGGGALFFYLHPACPVYLSDACADLIAAYQVVRDQPLAIIKKLSYLKNTKDDYYRIRSLDREAVAWLKMSKEDKAARFIYLNRTCFNGLYRVNKDGFFNTPYGCYPYMDAIPPGRIMSASSVLNVADTYIFCSDFAESVKGGVRVEGGFFYLDPPYDPVSRTSSFQEYQPGGFPEKDLYRLRAFCDYLTSRGAKFLLSESRTARVLEAFRGYHIETVSASRSIAAKSSSRKKVVEVVIRNYV